MPNGKNDMRKRRILAAWRTRACAAGLCVGAQIFLAGCAVGMPLALSSAWLAAVPALPFSAWLAVRCHRALMLPASRWTRTRCLMLLTAMLGCAAFSLASLTGFAAQTLTQQARTLWIEATALLAVVLCACSGGTGAARLCFALRYALPALVLGLSLADLPLRMPAGLFPLLGAGFMPLGLAAVSMLFGAAPALMLMLPPPELDEIPWSPQDVPDARFFLWRVLPGAVVGVCVLFLTSACTTYESIAQSHEWGARLRMAAGNQPHEGMIQMLLTLSKLMAMLLLSVNMLCCAVQALGIAFPRLSGRYAGPAVCAALLGGVLLVQILYGDSPLLTGAPLIAVLALAAALPAGRRPHA